MAIKTNTADLNGEICVPCVNGYLRTRTCQAYRTERIIADASSADHAAGPEAVELQPVPIPSEVQAHVCRPLQMMINPEVEEPTVDCHDGLGGMRPVCGKRHPKRRKWDKELRFNRLGENEVNVWDVPDFLRGNWLNCTEGLQTGFERRRRAAHEYQNAARVDPFFGGFFDHVGIGPAD